MWASTATTTQEDTYCATEAQALVAVVVVTLPLHGCKRRAVASAVTTALISKGENWSKEARVHFPDVFSEVAREDMSQALQLAN